MASQPIIAETPPEPPEGATEAPAERNWEDEARELGWRPAEDFPGDKARFVDAKTFVERADTMLPIIKADRDKLKREMAELKRTMSQYVKHAEGAEQRAYERALKDLEAKHDEAVEAGDQVAARKALNEIRDLKPATVAPPEPEFDIETARKELNAWVEENDWYVLDDAKRRYADMQADMMGPAKDWSGGQKAWLDELGKRVERKFASRPPNPVNPGGNRGAPSGGGKSYNDLPADAKRQCDRFVKQIPGFTREKYIKDYDWGETA